MNKKARDMLFLLIIIILAIGIGLIVNGLDRKEGFVPGLNAFYRPYARKLENFTSEKINNVSHHIHRAMKRFGLK
jgi:hypothetical protein